jgi:molecular chaperone IbpA
MTGGAGHRTHVASQEDVAMRNADFTPYFRSTIGFDRLFDLLDNGARSDWPPYNIEKKGADKYRITMAIAGFVASDIEIVQQGGALVVTGQKVEPQGVEMLHRGIPLSSFKQTFNVADHVKVVGANLDLGLLTIDLVHEVPEPLKPRRIPIGPAGETKVVETGSAQERAEKQIKAA